MSYADQLVPRLQALADALTAAGVDASLSRGSLRVPGAWVRPDTATGPVTLAGGGEARVSVLLVAPEGGDEEALTDLTDLLDKALTVLDPVEPVDTSVILPLNNNRLPAFRLVIEMDL